VRPSEAGIVTDRSNSAELREKYRAVHAMPVFLWLEAIGRQVSTLTGQLHGMSF